MSLLVPGVQFTVLNDDSVNNFVSLSVPGIQFTVLNDDSVIVKALCPFQCLAFSLQC